MITSNKQSLNEWAKQFKCVCGMGHTNVFKEVTGRFNGIRVHFYHPDTNRISQLWLNLNTPRVDSHTLCRRRVEFTCIMEQCENYRLTQQEMDELE